MNHRQTRLPAALALMMACSGTDTPYLPGGGVAKDSGGDSAGSGGPCPYTEWTAIGEAWVDPLTCTAWGPQEGSMDWYEAVSPEEAIAGGCSSHCDEDDSGYCSDMEPVDGLDGSWALPSISDLEALALRAGPFEPLSGDLWSRSSDTYMNQLAWTADLDQPGMEVTLDKGSGAKVRCMLQISR
jgi:hypothetical protein